MHNRLGSVVVVLATAYLIMIPCGLPANQRLQVADIGILALLILVSSGLVGRLLNLKVGNVTVELDKVVTRQALQATRLEAHQILITSLVTGHEVSHLRGLASPDRFTCYYHDQLYAEVRGLDARGLVSTRSGKRLIEIEEYKNKNKQFDLKDLVEISAKGRSFLRIYDEVKSSPSV